MTDNTKKPLDDYIPKDFGADTPRDNTKEDELRELFRKIIRDYYNKTFEYAMEQLQKGDISAVIANAESKQRALDDPYLDEIESVIQAAYITRAEHEKAVTEALYGFHQYILSKVIGIDHVKLNKSLGEYLAQLSDKEAS